MLLENKYIYVDKTELIHEIAKKPSAVIINAERRTGKTLFLSTIKAMFEQNIEWWQQYGADLNIVHKNPEFFNQNPFPVIGFRFSQCPNNEGFLKGIRAGMNNAIDMYQLGLREVPKNLPVESLVGDEFHDVLRKVKNLFKKPVVITIDEADQPLLKQMFDDKITETQRAHDMKKTIESFNQFYGFLKDQMAEGIVRLIVVAGHSMIAKSSIYSGVLLFFFCFHYFFSSAFNNPVILRHSPRFHNLLGFTKEEILLNFKDKLKIFAENQGKTEDQLLSELEQHYNGYKYNVEAKETLFNAFVIQNYFKSDGLFKMRDYFTESGGSNILLRSLNQQTIPNLRKYLDLFSNRASKVQIPLRELTTPKDWEDLQKDFKQNCFDAGYLTIEKVALVNKEYMVDLKIPNEEVFLNLKGFLKKYLLRNDKFGFIMMSLKQKNFKNFISNLEEVAFRDKTVLNLADKDDIIKEDANYEVVLHQMVTMTIHMALEEENEEYVLLNERKVPEGKG